MLKAARAHGRPIMVMAMMKAATTQAAAIHRPPKTIQSMFNNIETGGMRFSLKLEQGGYSVRASFSFEPTGKAPTVKPVLKCVIALVIKQACHDWSPWPDHLEPRRLPRLFRIFSHSKAGWYPLSSIMRGHRWTVPLLGRNSGASCSLRIDR